jgi:hypothetical protein
MTRKEMQTESIKKYKKKIAWAKTQDPKLRPNFQKMRAAIDMDCSVYSCPYCGEYRIKRNSSCYLCPLYCMTRYKLFDCCAGLWRKMVFCGTWKTWIKYAEKVLQYIKDHGVGELK